MKTWFTADPHFGHDGILAITFRDFESIAEHNSVLIDNINRCVGVKDRLFILGDFAWHGEQSWAEKIKCKNKHLLFGNHDKSRLGRLFTTAEDVAEIKIQDHKLFMSHYPHAYWPSSHHGSFHIYGHTHSQREATLDAAFPGRRALDVGVDNIFEMFGEYRPINEDELVAYMLARPGHDSKDFYEDLQTKRRLAQSRRNDNPKYGPAYITNNGKGYHVRRDRVDEFAGQVNRSQCLANGQWSLIIADYRQTPEEAEQLARQAGVEIMEKGKAEKVARKFAAFFHRNGNFDT